MTNKMKALIMAIIVFIGSVFGWYMAATDGNPDTKPDTQKVIEDGTDVIDKWEDMKETTVDEPETETPGLAE